MVMELSMKDDRSSGKVSLVRTLSKFGYCSRSRAIVLVNQGRVMLNGRIVRNPALRCLPDKSVIKVDGRRIRPSTRVYIAMNKPAGIVTTRSDERQRRTVYDLLGEYGHWLFPVGRLDKETSGLLIFTNDSRLGDQLTNPLSKLPKEYQVTLDKELKDEDRRSFEAGMMLDGVNLLPVSVRNVRSCEILMTLREGKNRQVRRMCEHLGYQVKCLKRIKIGRLALPALKSGEWRYLTPREVELLRA